MKPVWLWVVFLLVYGLFSMKTQAAEPSTVRVVSLADMGLSETITLHERHNEQHFYLPLPQDDALESVRIEVRGKFYHPFNDRSALTILVNGEPMAAHPLFRRDGGLSLRLVELGGAKYAGGAEGDSEREVSYTFPLKGVKSRGGFIDLGIVLSSQIDAEHCVDVRGHGDEFALDTKATRLVYAFKAGKVKDIRSLLATLPHRPVILLPGEQVGEEQYETALRLSRGLSKQGKRAQFVAIPRIGDVVGTDGLDELSDWGLIPSSGAIRRAAKTHSKVKLQRAEDVAAWLIAQMLARDGLAHIVVDPVHTRQALLAALRQAPISDALRKRIGGADRWLMPDKDNLRVAQLAGQPVLLVGDGKAAALLASLWQPLATTPGMGLETAAALDKEYDDDLHFARNLPVLNITSSGEWQIPLQLSDFPEGKWPDTFELNLMTAPGEGGQAPIASVLLNDNLLMVQALHTDGKITRVTAQAPLYSIRASNILKVQISRRSEGGHCSHEGQNAPVQLLPSSFVTFRGAPDTKQFYMLQPQLARHGQIVVPQRYLSHAIRSLQTVDSVLEGFMIGSTGFGLTVSEKAEFTPERPFIAFETAPASTSELVSTASGRLIVRNGREKTVFDSAGLGELAVVQLVQSHRKPGVYIAPMQGALPVPEQSLVFAEGSLAAVDAQGVQLAVNLDDPDNDYQLDEQNRGTLLIFQHYRVWFVLFGLLLLPVALVLGLRYYFRRQNRPQE